MFRKVNKSYRGRSCPMIVHCSDGVGRSGTYVLIDMVLNRMMKGSKEIDIAATLEHIRDQRAGRVKNNTDARESDKYQSSHIKGHNSVSIGQTQTTLNHHPLYGGSLYWRLLHAWYCINYSFTFFHSWILSFLLFTLGMVQTRSQFEFCLSAVAEETHAILKALPQ